MPQDAFTVNTEKEDKEESNQRSHILVHWFRHGLRIHDNPALLEALKTSSVLYPIFIFDGEVAGTKMSGYNRMRFLIESLLNLDESFKELGGRLYCFFGQPVQVFEKLIEEWGVTQVSFEAEPEPIWQERDNKVKNFLHGKKVKVVERISHTLWNPKEIIENNGGSSPLTFALFNLVTSTIGEPPRPVENPDFSKVRMHAEEKHDLKFGVPTPEQLGVEYECEEQKHRQNEWCGGETKAMDLLSLRLQKEEEAFHSGYVMPNQYQPDLVGPPVSMSAHLRFGCISVRLFYWKIHDKFRQVYPDASIPLSLTAQLLWREYFYTMSVDNIHYDKIEENPICLNIPWYSNKQQLERWTMGQTGYPWIDAIMNQMRHEGWIHHVCRHAVSCFLTRGDLWISWTEGLKVFLKYMLDADWSVCAGNWMWVSSSAFEKVLQCPNCFCPVRYGKRMDPLGLYVKRYVPVLKDMPLRYLFEPWKAPTPVQEKAKCIIGVDYPLPMVDHRKASLECMKNMQEVANALIGKDVPHCAPSNESEVGQFVWLPNHSPTGGKCNASFLCDSLENL